MRRPHLLHRTLPWLLLLLLATGCAYQPRQGASTVALSREAAARSVSEVPPVQHGLEVRPPLPDGETASIPWLELKGRVGTAALFESDTVIALDMSIGAHFPSGLDLDEDGVVGELRGAIASVGSYEPKRLMQGEPPPLSPHQWTTDPDDTVAALELATARALIAGLAQRRNRVGVMSYAHRPRGRYEVGAPRGALDALEEIQPIDGKRGTDIYAALRHARSMLDETPELPGFPRQRAVLLFTDGRPMEPVEPYIARIRALGAAGDLADAGIDLYVFTIGAIGKEDAKFLLELAGSGEGRLYRVGAPERMLADLPPVDLSPTWLRIENATTGEPARAVETRSDGHFEAFVPLAEGENRIRVLAELGDGKLQRWEGKVVHQPGDPPSAEQRAATERILRLIEGREAAVDAAAGPPSGPPE